jgi:hypothetical protein
MAWFHPTKLDHITQGRRARRVFAQDVRNLIVREEFYTTNIRTIEETIRAAKREDELYAEYLGERMPEHMVKALTVEIGIWMTLHDLLFKPPVSEEAYPALCRKLRPYIAVLIDLLLAEEEMMTSPLTQHYLYLIDELHAQAGADKP